MFYLPTAEEFIQEFSETARTTVDTMISNADKYGINPDDPWSEESLTALATKFLADTSKITTDEVTMFIGEGRVRIKGDRWSLLPESGKPLSSEYATSALRIIFHACVIRQDNKSGNMPLGWIRLMRDYNEPTALATFVLDPDPSDEE
ncbi:MAG: hypothetical protein Q4A82_01240 [Corynebacterium sp.]|nr:hypothetical protein [Corynebacterium sp.]